MTKISYLNKAFKDCVILFKPSTIRRSISNSNLSRLILFAKEYIKNYIAYKLAEKHLKIYGGFIKIIISKSTILSGIEVDKKILVCYPTTKLIQDKDKLINILGPNYDEVLDEILHLKFATGKQTKLSEHDIRIALGHHLLTKGYDIDEVMKSEIELSADRNKMMNFLKEKNIPEDKVYKNTHWNIKVSDV